MTIKLCKIFLVAIIASWNEEAAAGIIFCTIKNNLSTAQQDSGFLIFHIRKTICDQT